MSGTLEPHDVHDDEQAAIPDWVDRLRADLASRTRIKLRQVSQGDVTKLADSGFGNAYFDNGEMKLKATRNDPVAYRGSKRAEHVAAGSTAIVFRHRHRATGRRGRVHRLHLRPDR